MGSVVGSNGVLIGYNENYNPSSVPDKKFCYLFDPISGNTVASDDANCDATFTAPSGTKSNKVIN